MKKLILSGLLLGATLFVNAQNSDTTSIKNGGRNGNNEFKLNLIYTIAGIPELNYERILRDDMSVGIAVMVGVESGNDFNFGIIPNYRIYFGNKKANGFFIEGNAAVFSVENYGYSIYNGSTNSNVYYQGIRETNFGLGAAAGAKFLTKNGFVGEVYLGAGRLFGATDIDAYPRAGITIGKRF